jgi:hypothetical protein
MMYTIYCHKCNERSKLDIGDKTKEEVQKWLNDSQYGFQCFGNHVEIGARSEYWTIDWNNPIDAKAPTEDEFLQELKSKFKEVYTTKELQDKYTIQGFSSGMCVVETENGEKKVFDFTHSPKGTRYYIA